MSPMGISEHEVGDVTVLELDGRLILEEGELALRDAVDQLVAKGRVNIVLDFAQVTRIDSAGIGMLVAKYLSAINRGGRVKLLHLSSRADEMLRMTKLRTIFEIFESEAHAVDSFAPGEE